MSFQENSSAKPPRSQNLRTSMVGTRKTARLRKSENETISEMNEINKQFSNGKNNSTPLIALNDNQWNHGGKLEVEANLMTNDFYMSQERLGRQVNFQGIAKGEV